MVRLLGNCVGLQMQRAGKAESGWYVMRDGFRSRRGRENPSTGWPKGAFPTIGTGDGTRTHDLLVHSQAL